MPACIQLEGKGKLTDAPSCSNLPPRIYVNDAVPHEYGCLIYSSFDRSRRKEPSTAKKVYFQRIASRTNVS
jgi:hypothetical protein